MTGEEIESDPAPQSTSSFIDVRMIPSKCAYFLVEAQGGSFVPFITVFLTSIGLDVKEAGFISGIRLIASSISAPLWGFLADHTGRRTLILTILCLGTMLVIFPMPWIGRALNISSATNTTIYHGGGGITNQSAYFNSSIASALMKVTRAGKENNLNTIFAGIQKNLSNKTVGTSHLKKHTPFTSELFFVMLSLMFLSTFFSNPLNGYIDSLVMNIIKSSQAKTDYGRQRVFGGIGFGLTNFIAGVAADYYNEPTLSKYTAIFYVFMPSILLLIPTGFILSKQTTWETGKSDETIKKSKLKLLSSTFRDFDNIFFMLSAFVIGIANAVVIGFLFMLMEDKMHASKTAMGLANLVGSLIEIPVFLFSQKLIKLFRGNIPCIEIAVFSYFIRCVIVSYIENPWFVLPTQSLNSLGFALFWAAAVEHTQSIAPKEIYITMFSILASVYFNVAGVVGYLVSGVVYSNFSGTILFRATGYLCGVWVVLMVLYFHVIGFTRNRKKLKEQADKNNDHSLDNYGYS